MSTFLNKQETMARDDDVVHEEEDDQEEDLATAMEKIPIPLSELYRSPIDFSYDFTDILDDLEDLEVPTHNEPTEDSNSSKLNSTNPPTVTIERFLGPKRSINKRGRTKRRCVKTDKSNLDSKSVNVTDKSCLHCGTRKTPLWREGPEGPGTLCNACGVRYRTGRLYPEYRPASSPDFKPNVHSNYHKKVMEMRRERNSSPPTQ